MVFFTCNNCGTTIKKNQVSAHKFKCPNANVSCIDCGKDFWGTEYEAHIKCISEEEKYSGKNFVPKASSNKGQKRQDDWLDCLNQLLKSGNLKKHIRNVVEKLVNMPNVPQKKAKFENFLKNTSIRSPVLIAEVWGVIAKSLEELKATRSALAKPPGDVSAVKQNGEGSSEKSNEQLIKTEIIENETKSEKAKKRKGQKKSTSEEDLENIDIKSNEAENNIKKKKKNSKNKEDSNTENVESETKSEKDTSKEKSKKRKRPKKGTSEGELENSKNLENIEVKGNEVDNGAENATKKRKKNSENDGDSKSEIMENETKSEIQTAKGKSKRRKRQKKGASEKELKNSKNFENIDVKGNSIDNGAENGIKKKKKNSQNNGSKSEEILSPAKENIKHALEADSATCGKENGAKKRKKNSQKEIESPANKKIKHGQSKLNKVK